MAAPFEIVASPLTVWLADVGTAFPAIGAAPSGSWIKLGASGTKNYTEDGVTVRHAQTVEVFRPAGGTGPRKAWRTEEELVIEFTLVDISPDQYAQVLNEMAITTGAGQKSFSLQQGLNVEQFALLARGLSSVDDTKNAQYQVPIVVQVGEPEVAYVKGEPAGLSLSFMALEHSTDGFGTLVIAT